MRRLAFIPARGGSKRLPRKNIIDFLGKPIIAWTIEAAKNSKLFDKIVVSTEDDEIAEVAQSFGAEIDKRKASLATDEARVVDVCLEYLQRAEGRGETYDILCCLYATAPLRAADDIQKTVELLDDSTDFALAVSEYDLPPHQALKVDGDHYAKAMWPEWIHKRSADVGRLIVDNGSTYAMKTQAFKKHKEFLVEPMRVHVMPRERSQDIDVESDLDLARFYGQRMAVK